MSNTKTSTTPTNTPTTSNLPTLTKEEVLNIFTSNKSKKSPTIRHLSKMGYTTSQITKSLQLLFPNHLYQHTRNVLNQKFNG